MKRSFCILFAVVASLLPLIGQESIDGTIDFQSDPAKKYSLYIPSGYTPGMESAAMVCLHPLNTRRWDGRAWRDTLIRFAEINDLMLICPDGGSDGRIDDPIDTAFTSFLVDSMFRAYDIDEEQLYVMGFSWGGRATYTYGLSNINRFAGLMIIGAAINGLNEVGSLTENAARHNIAIIHGSNDSPNVRFYPVRDALIEDDACVYDTLMSGIGHTIDFPNRNDILSNGYAFLRDNTCEMTTLTRDVMNDEWAVKNPLAAGTRLDVPENINLLQIYDLNGRRYDAQAPMVFEDEGIYMIHYRTHTGLTGIAKVIVSSNGL